MNRSKHLLTAHDIDRMYKEAEAKYPKVMKHIRDNNRIRKNMYK